MVEQSADMKDIPWELRMVESLASSVADQLVALLVEWMDAKLVDLMDKN